MKNPGFNPFSSQDNPPMVDLKYRNEWIVRGVSPNKYRWKTWGWESPFDIVTYQEAR